MASKLDDGFNEESDGEDGEGGWDDDDVEVELEEEVEEKKEVNKKTKEKEMKEQSTNTVAVAVTVTGTGTETVETEVKNKLTAAQLAMLYKQIETLSASEIKNSALVIEMADENNVLKESVAEWTGRANKCREDRTLVVNEKKEITEDLGQKLLAAEDRVKELEVKLSGSDDGDGDCSSQELMAAERRVEELEMKLLESEDLGQKLISEVKQLEMKLLESVDLGQKLISAENQITASEIKNSALVIEMADENNVLKESVAEWTGRANKCREDRTLVVNEKKEITEDLGQKLLAAEDRVKELEVKLSGSDDGDGDCSSQELMAAERRVEELEMKLLESEDLGQKLISEVKQLEMKLLESVDLGQKLISAENQIKELENNSQVVSAQHEEQQQQFVAAVSRVKELEMKLSETSGSSDGSLVKLEAQLETQEMLDNDSDNADGGDGGGGGWGDEDDDWGEDL